MSKNKNIVFVLILILVLSCSTQQAMTKTTKGENFEVFSKRFYKDSLFQISRIKFPLKGLYNIAVPLTSTNAMGDSIINGWKKKDWVMLKNSYFPNNDSILVIENTTYLRKIQKTAKSVTIKTYIENSGFSVTEKFALKNGMWYLIYFSSLSY